MRVHLTDTMEDEWEKKNTEYGNNRLDKGDNKEDERGEFPLLETAAAEDFECESDDGDGEEHTLDSVVRVGVAIIHKPVESITLALVENVNHWLTETNLSAQREVLGGDARADHDRGPRELVDEKITTHVLGPPFLELGNGGEDVEDSDQDVGESDGREEGTQRDDDDPEDAETAGLFVGDVHFYLPI